MRRAALSKDAERSDTMVTKTYDWKLMVLIVERFIQWINSVVLVLVFFFVNEWRFNCIPITNNDMVCYYKFLIPF